MGEIEAAELRSRRDRDRLKGNGETESFKRTEFGVGSGGEGGGEERGAARRGGAAAAAPPLQSVVRDGIGTVLWKVTVKREFQKAGKAGWVGGHQPPKKQKILLQLIFSYFFPQNNITNKYANFLFISQAPQFSVKYH